MSAAVGAPLKIGGEKKLMEILDPRIEKIEKDEELDLCDVFSALELIPPSFLKDQISPRVAI